MGLAFEEEGEDVLFEELFLVVGEICGLFGFEEGVGPPAMLDGEFELGEGGELESWVEGGVEGDGDEVGEELWVREGVHCWERREN